MEPAERNRSGCEAGAGIEPANRFTMSERYRGGYILTLESSLGNIEKLVPTDSVDF